MCKIKVKSNDQAVKCNKCELWQHTTCINMAQTTYNALKKKTAKVKNALWLCDNCLIGMSKQDTTSSSLLNKITILFALITTVCQLLSFLGCIKSEESSGVNPEGVLSGPELEMLKAGGGLA